MKTRGRMGYFAFMNEKDNRERDAFFGKGNWSLNDKKEIIYNPVLDNDNIILRTNNIRIVDNMYVLVIGNDTGIVLKDECVKRAVVSNLGLSTYIVKLNRQSFLDNRCSYEDIECEFDFDNEEDFGFLLEVASQQNNGTIIFMG